jgi:branched-chain amino acid transport system substrate-binding protein
MKRSYSLISLLVAVLFLSGCINRPFQCADPLGCAIIGNKDSIKIGALLTLTGPKSPDGIDALRGIEIAITDKGQVFGHTVELIQQDDLCTPEGGQTGAGALAANLQLVGVIGATCSSSSEAAAKALTDAGMVLISPSSSLPSLTDPSTHQIGFLRAVYNDAAQAEIVAKFAYAVLAERTMITINDGTNESEQLQQAVCRSFGELGGQCIQQIQITAGQDPSAVFQGIASARPGVIFYQVESEQAITITNGLAQSGLENVALIGSGSLLNRDFILRTQPYSQGMYLSGAVAAEDAPDFLQKYRERFGEDPVASYHLQAYDAITMLLAAIEHVAIPISSKDNSIAIPRQALRNALYSIKSMNGLSGRLACNPNGDCAQPNIGIFQIVDNDFKSIYP